MSAEREGKDRSATWVIALLLAAPVLYVLTLPPLFIVVVSGQPAHATPNWLKAYAEPARWVARNTSLDAPMRAYDKWWRDRPIWSRWANAPAP